MLISIITVVKNDLVRLKNTISNLNYIYNDINFEHIIVDGVSDDKTKYFVKKKQFKNKNIIFASSFDCGIYDAMNRGAEFSNGDFVLFLNAGDRLITNKHDLINTLKKFLDTDVNIICFPFHHEFAGQMILRFPKQKNKDKLPTSHQAMFFSKSFIKNNKYNLDYKYASDFDFYLRSDPNKIFLITEFEPISIVEFDGITSKNLSLSYNEYKKIISIKFYGILKYYLLIKINIKVNFVILLKYMFSKSVTFKIRKFFDN